VIKALSKIETNTQIIFFASFLFRSKKRKARPALGQEKHWRLGRR
jgi:hypothetical protein